VILKENLARRGLINAIIVTAVAGTDKQRVLPLWTSSRLIPFPETSGRGLICLEIGEVFYILTISWVMCGCECVCESCDEF